MTNRHLSILVCLGLALLMASPALAKKKKKQDEKKAASLSAVEKKIQGFNEEDRRLFEALSKEQQKQILEGKIAPGFNAWMVRLALGEPYYGTEHHPVFTDYEEVWLYTKPEIQDWIDEERILDPQTNWPSLHRKTKKQTCTIGDFFVLWDRGVVEKIQPEKIRMVHGTCTIETREAFLPIVNGKPVEPK